MNCNEFEKLALLEDSGELSRTQQDLLRNHLLGCDSCRRFRAVLSPLRQGLQAGGLAQATPTPSPAVLKSILDAAERHNRRNPWALNIPWQGVLAAAASLALCLAGLRFLSPGPLGHASPGVAKVQAATELIPLVALVMGGEASLEAYNGESEMSVLADQLLILQGMKVETREDLRDELSPLEDSQPTTLQWNSSPELHPERCG